MQESQFGSVLLSFDWHLSLAQNYVFCKFLPLIRCWLHGLRTRCRNTASRSCVAGPYVISSDRQTDTQWTCISWGSKCLLAFLRSFGISTFYGSLCNWIVYFGSSGHYVCLFRSQLSRPWAVQAFFFLLCLTSLSPLLRHPNYYSILFVCPSYHHFRPPSPLLWNRLHSP